MNAQDEPIPLTEEFMERAKGFIDGDINRADTVDHIPRDDAGAAAASYFVTQTFLADDTTDEQIKRGEGLLDIIEDLRVRERDEEMLQAAGE